MELNLTKPQSEVFQLTCKHRACIAGLGSGKTFTSIICAIHTLLTHRQTIAMYEPNHNLIRTILMPEMTKNLTEIGIPYSLNKSEGIITTPYGNILFKSLNDFERIVGFEVLANFVDELDILDIEHGINAYHKLAARARLKSNNPLYKDKDVNFNLITSSPEGYKSCYELHVRNPLPDSKMIRMATTSNPYLPSGYIDGLKAQYPEQLIKAYIEGAFVSLTAQNVYYTFHRDDHVVKQTAPTKTETIHAGLDFNVGQMACAIFVERKNSKDEIVYLLIDEIAQGRDTVDVIAKLRDRYPRNEIIVYPDASGSRTQTSSMSRSDHTMLRQSGFTVKVNSINPRIKDRIISVNNAFEKGKLYVSAGCKRSIDALEQQAYDKDGFPEKTNSEHLASAIGYFVAYVMPVATSEVRYRAIQLL